MTAAAVAVAALQHTRRVCWPLLLRLLMHVQAHARLRARLHDELAVFFMAAPSARVQVPTYESTINYA